MTATLRERFLIRGGVFAVIFALAAFGLIPVSLLPVSLLFLTILVLYGLLAVGRLRYQRPLEWLIWSLDLILLAFLLRFTGGAGSPLMALVYVWLFGMITLHVQRGVRVPLSWLCALVFGAFVVGSLGQSPALLLLWHSLGIALFGLIGSRLGLERRSGELDTLTQVYTRGAGLSRLVERHAEGEHFVLAFLDMHGFKRINDNYGHQVGDEVLAIFAARLNAVVRKRDLVIRYGGDEFLVASDVSVESRLRQVLAAPLNTSACEISLHADVGEELLKPGDSLQEVLKRADARMYAAKGSRRAGA